MAKYVCETCHKHLSKNVIPCQAVCNIMEIDPIPNELKDLKCLEKILISKSNNAWKREIFNN